MGIISVASEASCWRSLDYYENKSVTKLKKINDSEFTSLLTDLYLKYIILTNK